MKRKRVISILFVALLLLLNIGSAVAQDDNEESRVIQQAPFNAADTARIKEIAKMLPKKCGLYAVPITNRKVWDEIAKNPNFANVISDAEPYLGKEFPAWSDSLYCDFYETGERPAGQAMLDARENCINKIVLAECLENKGRFLPLIEEGLISTANQNSWTLPAHDRWKANISGKSCSVDLNAATSGANYAVAYATLGDKLSKECRETLLKSIYRHVLDPVKRTMLSGNGSGWLKQTTNWNAVCLYGVTTVALSVIESPLERAAFVHLAEKYSENSIVGYPQDGYCTEGLGYHNYGFGNYIVLREILYQATEGKIDLFSDEKIRNIALFSHNIGIVNGVYPYNADCRWGVKASPYILNYCSRNLGLGLAEYDNLKFDKPDGDFAKTCLNILPNTATETPAAKSGAGFKLRHFFEVSNVLITRYAKDSGCNIAAAIKGGHNGEHHNHNDVGTYSVVVGNETLVGDVGGPTAYTDKTFSDKRYILYKVLSSFGHPVPLINGNEQRAGRKSAAKLISKNFTDEKDEFVIDIASAYSQDAKVDKLERHYELDRQGKGTFTIRDEFSYKVSQPFESAITTRSKYEISPDEKSITIIGEKSSVKIEITASGSFNINTSEITTESFTYTRIGVQVGGAKEGELQLKYIPL
ncbi:MAG: hypothetical protein R3Y50_01900 [Rikenellaceae bacterium]